MRGVLRIPAMSPTNHYWSNSMTTTSKFASKAANAEALKTIRAKVDAPKVRRTKAAVAAREATQAVEQRCEEAADHIKAESAYEAYMRRTAQLRDEFLATENVPTATRVVVASVSHLLALSVTLYWGIEAATAVMAAAMILTSSVFITWVVGFIGLVLALYAALQAGSAIGDIVLKFDTKRAAAVGHDLRVAAAKRISLVKGWFTKPIVELELTPKVAS